MSGVQTYSPIAIRVENLWIEKGGGLFSKPKSIVQDVSFNVDPGVFVAVVGPNGAGKTTLFKALIGEKPARGRILFYKDDGTQTDFEEFYDNPEYWMSQIGYVPVDNVLHGELTVRQALMHIGKLRLPGKNDNEVLNKIRAVISGLGFESEDERLDQIVNTLSSGERKRMNIAAELLTDPPLLLLDEPTSNLDPNAERDLMDSLKQLAGSKNKGNGPTILLITHTLESIDRCEQVVFIENSQLSVVGTEDYVFDTLERKMGRECPETVIDSESRFEGWASIFDCYHTRDERSQRDRKPPPKQRYDQAQYRMLAADSFWRQFRILSSRYFILRLNDLNGIFTILLSGFIAGFLLLVAPNNVFLEADDATAARQAVVLYVILIVIMGAFNSHREVSKEFSIYIHERTKGLKPLAYIMSKLVWLGTTVGIFATTILLALTGMPLARGLAILILVVIGVIAVWSVFASPRGRDMRTSQRLLQLGKVLLLTLPLLLAFLIQLQNKELPSFPVRPTTVDFLMTLTMFLTAIAAVALGILVSSVVGGNNDRATQLVILVIIFNVILAFSVLNVTAPEFHALFDTLEPFAGAYWGYSGVSSSLSIYCWSGAPRFENFNSAGNIGSVWLYLLIHIIAAVAIGVFSLRLQETWTSRLRQFSHMLRGEAINYVTVVTVVALLSWALFLQQQSQSYFELTFFDRLFGGNRYANIETQTNLNSGQLLFGIASRSFCAVPEEVDDELLAQVPPILAFVEDGSEAR